MISNKSNEALIAEVLESFMNNGINRLKESLERLFNQLMISERTLEKDSHSECCRENKPRAKKKNESCKIISEH